MPQSTFSELDVTEQQLRLLKRDIFQRRLSHFCNAGTRGIRSAWVNWKIVLGLHLDVNGAAYLVLAAPSLYSSVVYLPTTSASSPTVVKELLFM